MRRFAIVTVGRSDWGIFRPLARKLKALDHASLEILVSGMHLAPEFGMTERMIEQDGFPIAARVDMLVSSDYPDGLVKSLGLGVISFGQVFSLMKPDLLLVLGDRFEMFAAALAAFPLRIPIAHIHGGELTFGALDEGFRHAMTKLSHLHFAATCEYAGRIVQMGEEPWRVVVSGALALDELDRCELLSHEELERYLGVPLDTPPILVTYHPETNTKASMQDQLGALLNSLDRIGRRLIFTMPNADPSGRAAREMITSYVAARKTATFVDNLGTRRYFSLMSVAGVMVGNSSSGIIEAPSFGLPAVNIGSRQDGRIRGGNVIDTGFDEASIEQAIRQALSPPFQKQSKASPNPYYRNESAATIAATLMEVDLGDELLTKRFYDLPAAK